MSDIVGLETPKSLAKASWLRSRLSRNFLIRKPK